MRANAWATSTQRPCCPFAGRYSEVVAAIGNFTPRVLKRDNNCIAVLNYVRLGHGIAVVPQIVKEMNFLNVVFRDIAADPVPQASIAFVYRDDPSPPTKQLIKHMRRHALPPHRSGACTQPRCVMIRAALHVDRHPDEVVAQGRPIAQGAMGTQKRPSKDEARAPRSPPLEARPSAEHLGVMDVSP
jgi:hypothetical protein